jgi:hypothetical protein
MGVSPALPGTQQRFDMSGGRLRVAIDETPKAAKHTKRSVIDGCEPGRGPQHVGRGDAALVGYFLREIGM